MFVGLRNLRYFSFDTIFLKNCSSCLKKSNILCQNAGVPIGTISKWVRGGGGGGGGGPPISKVLDDLAPPPPLQSPLSQGLRDPALHPSLLKDCRYSEAGMALISECTALPRSWILEKGFPAKADLSFGKSQKSNGANSGECGGSSIKLIQLSCDQGTSV